MVTWSISTKHFLASYAPFLSFVRFLFYFAHTGFAGNSKDNGNYTLDFSKPEYVGGKYATARWRKFVDGFSKDIAKPEMIEAFMTYACNRWNDRQTDPKKRVNVVRLTFMSQGPDPQMDGNRPPPVRRDRGEFDCNLHILRNFVS
jgi:hypothetical protein